MNNKNSKRPWALKILIFLLFFQGFGALPGGFLFIVDPSGGLMQMPPDSLKGEIFTSFLVPSLFLFTVLGLGAIFLACSLYFLPDWSWAAKLNPTQGHHWTFFATMLFGVILMSWITVQAYVVIEDSWLQPFYFTLGLIFVLMPITPWIQRYLRR